MSAPAVDERARRVLDERRRRLARPLTDESPEARLDVVVCELGGRSVAFPTAAVREVLPPGEAARLPTGRHLLVGIRNLRGDILVVADLHRLLDPGARPASATGPVVVVDGAPPVGVAVDAVTGTASLPAHEVAPPPERPAGGVVLGMTPAGVTVVDAAAVATDPRLHVAPSRAQSGRGDQRGDQHTDDEG